MTSFGIFATEQAMCLSGDVSWAQYGNAKPRPEGRTLALENHRSTL